jgi:hypothetical protein
MKRIIILLTAALFTASQVSAQNEEDALRYSRQFITGTARAVGMGGAMGAIGGDFTSLSINPAGIGVYRSSEFTISPSLNWNSTTSDFLGNKIEQTRYGMRIGNMGYIVTNKTDKEKGFVSSSFGFGYNQLNNFNQQTFMSGTSTNSSLLDNFTNIYNSNDPAVQISDFYEGLAYDVALLDLDTTSGKYFNDFERGGLDQNGVFKNYGQLQKRTVSTSGHIGEYVFSAGTNYSNWLYLGATMGLQRVKFNRTTQHTETAQGNYIKFTDEFIFNEDLSTRGYGFNMKVGAIVRPVDFLRLGAAFHTSTLYFLSDHFESDIISWAWYDPGTNISSKTASSTGDYDYTLMSPSKFVGSAAVTIGKLGLLSVDYERINYSNARLEGSDYGFILENNMIKDNFKTTDNLRMGAELRISDMGYVRGGYAMYGSPLKSPDPAADSKYSVISGGVGIRNSDFFMDVSYQNGLSKEAYYMYLPEMTNGSINTSTLNNIIFTLGFRF